MQVVSPSPFDFSPSRAVPLEGGNGAGAAPQLAGLGAKLTNDKEQPEAFADELEQALLGAGLLAAVAPQIDLPQAAVQQQATDFILSVPTAATDEATVDSVTPLAYWSASLSPPASPYGQLMESNAASDAQSAVTQEISLKEPAISAYRPDLDQSEASPVLLDTNIPQDTATLPESPTTQPPAVIESVDVPQTSVIGPPHAFGRVKPATPANAVAIEQTLDSRPAEIDIRLAAVQRQFATQNDGSFERFSGPEAQALVPSLAGREPILTRNKRLDMASGLSTEPSLQTTNGRWTDYTRPVEAPPAAIEQVAQSILATADYAQSGGTADFHLRLEPPHLGTVRVLLTASDETVHLRLIVHDTAARQHIETQMDSLRQRLEDAGISLGRFDVLQDQSNSSHNWQPPTLPNVEPLPPAPRPFIRPTALHSSVAASSSSGLVDVMA